MKNIPLVYNKLAAFIFVIISIVSISCEKVVDIDLNSSSPRIVIEGSISDQAGPYVVTLSQTVNFDETNVFPPMSGANIVLSDNVGNSESLIETLPGIYKTSSMRGLPGRTYTLAVTADGQEYIAVSTMPNPVRIDYLTVQDQNFGRNQMKVINVQFRDPHDIKNYYRFVEVKNKVEQKFIFLYDDRVQDGSAITSSLFADEDTLQTGDTVIVWLQCIDKGVFDYFRTMRQASGGGGPQAASPANPLSNFTNGALGYFNAYAVRGDRIIIP
jgi:hypothetical protein